jgi:hypothetical protein
MFYLVLLFGSLAFQGEFDPGEEARRPDGEVVSSFHSTPPNHAHIPAVIRLAAPPVVEGLGPSRRLRDAAIEVVVRQRSECRLDTALLSAVHIARTPIEDRSPVLRC